MRHKPNNNDIHAEYIMGDRVLVQFKHNGRVSPVCYMHWAGDEAVKYIKDCAKVMKDRQGDLDYTFARFVGICHENIPGNCSLGVWSASKELTEADTHGDAGCYVVDIATGKVNAFGGYGKPFKSKFKA